MEDKKNLPEIDTSDFEASFNFESPEQKLFLEKRQEFKQLIFQIIEELDLLGKIESLAICSPATGRAMLYREKKDPWPSKKLCLDIYTDRYLDENLIRHEFMHEADRWNPDMKYDPEIERKWGGSQEHEKAVFETILNISVDSRLANRGLGKEKRRKNFHELMGKEFDELFEDIWASPPNNWPEFEKVTIHLLKLINNNS